MPDVRTTVEPKKGQKRVVAMIAALRGPFYREELPDFHFLSLLKDKIEQIWFAY